MSQLYIVLKKILIRHNRTLISTLIYLISSYIKSIHYFTKSKIKPCRIITIINIIDVFFCDFQNLLQFLWVFTITPVFVTSTSTSETISPGSIGMNKHINVIILFILYYSYRDNYFNNYMDSMYD